MLDANGADACGGCFVPASEVTVVTDHRMALSVSPQQTVLWDQIRYSGDPREFAWVLPIRAGAKIEVANDEFFTALDASSQPVVFSPRRFGGNGCALTGCSSETSASDTSGSGNDDGVQILSQSVVGPYEQVTLRSTDDSALVRWLRKNDFAIPASIEPTIDAYVGEGFDFIALKLRPECGERSMRPVRVVWRGADPTLPLRMVAAGVGARVGITLYVITEGRYEPQNFESATVDDGDLRWNRFENKSNYESLSQEIMARADGRTWITEYADRPRIPLTGTGWRPPSPQGSRFGRSNAGLADTYFGLCRSYRAANPPPPTSGTSTPPPAFTPCPEQDSGGRHQTPDDAGRDAGEAGIDDAGPDDSASTTPASTTLASTTEARTRESPARTPGRARRTTPATTRGKRRTRTRAAPTSTISTSRSRACTARMFGSRASARRCPSTRSRQGISAFSRRCSPTAGAIRTPSAMSTLPPISRTKTGRTTRISRAARAGRSSAVPSEAGRSPSSPASLPRAGSADGAVHAKVFGSMPELPDVDVYVEHIAARTKGHAIERVRLASPFVLRTADPPIAAAYGRKVERVSRLGKRIVFDLASATKGEAVLHLVIHLMVAGRFRWKPLGAPVPGKLGLAAFDFAPEPTAKVKDGGTLILTEASSKKRASIHLVNAEGLAALDPGGMEVMNAKIADLAERLRSENHTLKRALTDPHLFSGIGNAYSDEILHHAQMSPVKLTQRLTDDEIAHLFESTRIVLQEWTNRLRDEVEDFPEGVTAFRPEMAVHGKYGKPCPRCKKPVQRIRYAANESNYCPTCQTEGKLLADRSLSRLMRGDWPKTLEDLEAKKQQLGKPAAAGAKKPAVVKEPKPKRR